MKTVFLKCALVAATILAALQPPFTTGHAQGSLTPPGAPAPTMKSLDQIEPRTIVNAVNTPGDAGDAFIIRQPGSYYLTTNLNITTTINGITILTNNVTLDLSGFTLQGDLAYNLYGPNAINIPGAITNLVVRNGTLINWGNSGVEGYLSGLSQNLVFERLNISGCSFGIYLSGSGVIRNCTVGECINDGIDCDVYGSLNGGIIAGCTVANNGGGGISLDYGTVSGCVANNNADIGIYVNYGNVTASTADDNGYDGIYDGHGTASGCATDYNIESGIQIFDGTAFGCTASGNGDSGILGTQVSVSGCTAAANGNNGIEVDVNSGNALGGKVSDCVVQLNRANGIFVNSPGGLVTGNDCVSNNVANSSGCAGINIYFSNGNRIQNNQVVGSSVTGISVSGSNNFILQNTVTGNGANDFTLQGNQIVGTIITTTAAVPNASPWANFGF